MGRTFACMATTCLLLMAASASAGTESLGAGFRKLMELPAFKMSFPFRKCIKDANNSPYLLSGPAVTYTADSRMVLDFTIAPATSPNTETCSTCSNCYAGLVDNVQKLIIRSGAACAKPGVIKGVYVNGVKKVKGITWGLMKNGNAVLRLANLGLTSNVVGTRISITLDAPCNSPEAFTGPKGGDMYYFFANSTKIECCPISSWDWGASYQKPAPAPVPSEESSGLEGSGDYETSVVSEGSSADLGLANTFLPDHPVVPSPDPSPVPSPEPSPVPSPEVSPELHWAWPTAIYE